MARAMPVTARSSFMPASTICPTRRVVSRERSGSCAVVCTKERRLQAASRQASRRLRTQTCRSFPPQATSLTRCTGLAWMREERTPQEGHPASVEVGSTTTVRPAVEVSTDSTR
ncbi:hypothetical protein GCM10023166_02540 [Paeniglutamicibacter cryotolerans]|uniref:Uncharacterized protein n=1 Tax=Paeniglutamicibacter cryotolerans TaxID=670079 RepID=A0A839QFK7_9MICC|nr:hypothetical protein [Paeniglutamicibacter cryotolerans]